jgi:ribosomal 50S subunit-recycling heat shock protein
VREVRLDKFLKVSRLVKRRTLAQELCDGGHVKRNGRTAKSSTSVEVGDMLELTFGPRKVECKVAKLMETADKKTAGEMYELISGG